MYMEFPTLNIPQYPIRMRRTTDGGVQFWDECRRRWLEATPEEWVRQNFLAYLISERGCPVQFVSTEYPVKVNGQSQRVDIMVFDSAAQPWLLVECKATDVPLSQEVLMQAARYNMVLNVPFLVVTNGVETRCFGRKSGESLLTPCQMPLWK